MQPANIFSAAPFNPDCEYLEKITEHPGFSLERIVSHGHRTPDGSWCDSDQDEWVVLLSGGARIQIENQQSLVDMQPGSHLTIPAHTRHRVEWTDETCETVWLALHTDV